jgi:hypothetical protein
MGFFHLLPLYIVFPDPLSFSCNAGTRAFYPVRAALKQEDVQQGCSEGEVKENYGYNRNQDDADAAH